MSALAVAVAEQRILALGLVKGYNEIRRVLAVLYKSLNARDFRGVGALVVADLLVVRVQAVNVLLSVVC